MNVVHPHTPTQNTNTQNTQNTKINNKNVGGSLHFTTSTSAQTYTNYDDYFS